MSEDKRPPSENPKFGYGDVDARPDVDGTEAVDNAYPNAKSGQPPSEEHGGQTDPAYTGPANDNATRKPGS